MTVCGDAWPRLLGDVRGDGVVEGGVRLAVRGFVSGESGESERALVREDGDGEAVYSECSARDGYGAG